MRVGGTENIYMLYTLEEIQSDFENFEIIALEESEIFLREGDHDNGVSCVIRFVAKKL